MAVYDRWHKSHPKLDNPNPALNDQPCKCGRGRHKLYPTKDHLKGKRWQVRWYDEKGRQPKRNFDKKGGGRDETDPEAYAEAYDAKIQAELNAGTYIDPSAGKITLEDYAKQWRAGLTIDPLTITQIDSRLGKWVYGSTIGTKEMRTLAKYPSLIQAWIKGMEQHLKPSTIQGIVGWVSTVFEVAMIDGVVTRNPVKTEAVKPPKVLPKRVVPWTLDQIDTAAEDLPARYQAMPYVGAGAGMRQGEIFGLAKTDIQLMLHIRRQIRIVDGHLVFSPPKGGKLRDLPICDDTRRRLKAHIKTYPPVKVTLPWIRPDAKETITAELVFADEAGEPLNRNNVNRLWRPARRAAGVPDTRDNGMHVLRHTAASAWLAEGVDINTVAAWLGHDDPGFTLRTYIHLMPNAADRGRRAMDAFFSRSDPGQDALDMPSRDGDVDDYPGERDVR